MKSLKVDYADLPKYKNSSPEFNYCRKLIKDGVDPNTKIEFYRGDMKCFTIEKISRGAELTIEEWPYVYFKKYIPMTEEKKKRLREYKST